MIVWQTISRVAPHRVVTKLRPTNSELVAGQEISVTFNEPVGCHSFHSFGQICMIAFFQVNCDKPYWFVVSVSVNGDRNLAIGSEAIVSCEANTIFVEIGGIQVSSLAMCSLSHSL